MPTAQKTPQGTAPAKSAIVSVLNAEGYRSIRKKGQTIEVNLAYPLYRKKITASLVRDIVLHKAPPSGQYNAVFHFQNGQKTELTEEIKKARSTMPNTRGNWFIIMRKKGEQEAAKKRALKAAPKGQVKAFEVNKVLKRLAEI